jgi:hypothetical protein
MSTTFRTFFLVFCSSILFINGVHALTISKDSILLQGTIYNNTDKVKDAVIEIYDKNTLIKKIEVQASGRFKTNLPINAFLTIEIDAPDFHEKRFIFDSHVPDNLSRLPNYEFDMDVFTEEELEGVNTSLLDFPAGIVYYHERKGKFVHNKDYTKQMKKEYYRLLEEAKMSERNALED